MYHCFLKHSRLLSFMFLLIAQGHLAEAHYPCFSEYISVSLENPPFSHCSVDGHRSCSPWSMAIPQRVSVPVLRSHLLLTFYSRYIFYSAFGLENQINECYRDNITCKGLVGNLGTLILMFEDLIYFLVCGL